MILILLISSIIGVLYFTKRLKIIKKYKEYLHTDSPLTGYEAASMMMQRAGYDCKFAIFNGQSTDPFYGNFYLPDKNLFVMKREIMDGKNMLGLVIGCQLASSALRYRGGDICKDISTSFENEYALQYIFKDEEFEQVNDLNIF